MERVASKVKMSEKLTHKFILILKRNHPLIEEREMLIEVFNTETKVVRDWR